MNRPRIKQNILVVDDDESTRIALIDVLRHDGYNALSAEDGFVATRIVREKSLDLVFLDFELPGMNGLDVLREIKTINMQLPVVMLTGASGAELLEWAMNAGALALLYKPVELRAIRQTVQHILIHF
jgi:two-component system response regulator (stage 0 sporulation protein F)